MAKNILIFCDGTGQVGGVHFDEPRTNVYKMYRAMRCGPDSAIDPVTQVAFYDPGIGSTADGGGLVGGSFRILYNIVAQATGFGITRNIVECYAAVIRLWEPGDRIWLFGFSRGAYTARCVAEVLALCGIPRKTSNGQALKHDQRSVFRAATHAVKHVYQFTAPRPPGQAQGKQAMLEKTRLDLAVAFRTKHGARPDLDDGTYPYFVGVFDTVAALINPPLAAGLTAVALLASLVVAFVGSLMFSAYGHRLATFGWSWLTIVVVTIVVGTAAYVREHLKADYGGGVSRSLATAHMTDAYPRFYDHDLDENISYAKHAISIDENRASFKRVPWGHGRRKTNDDAAHRPWFEQVWFAGNHADIGGGYSENESRLSDIALEWMVDCACEVPGDLRFDASVLRRWPSATGPQHDQVAAGFGWFTRLTNRTWPAAARTLPTGRIAMHKSVYDRFEAEHVPYWDGPQRYRPEPLSAYPDVEAFFKAEVPSGTKARRDSLARLPEPARWGVPTDTTGKIGASA